jgi:hypothetical protein
MDRFRSSFQRLNPNASRWGLGERNASHQPPKLESARANLGVTGIAALDQDVVIHTPILATTGDEVRGHPVVVKILQTAFACYGMPRNVEEFQNPDGRYIVTFDGKLLKPLVHDPAVGAPRGWPVDNGRLRR